MGCGVAGTKRQASVVCRSAFGRGRILPGGGKRLIQNRARMDALRSGVARVAGRSCSRGPGSREVAAAPAGSARSARNTAQFADTGVVAAGTFAALVLGSG